MCNQSRSKRAHISTDNTSSAHTIDPTSYVDEHVIQNIRDLSTDTDFVRDVIETFITDATSLLSEMETAIANMNFTLYLEHVHALKGSAGSVGANLLFEQCKSTLLQAPDDSGYISNLKETNQLLHATKNELFKYLSPSTTHPVEGSG